MYEGAAQTVLTKLNTVNTQILSLKCMTFFRDMTAFRLQAN